MSSKKPSKKKSPSKAARRPAAKAKSSGKGKAVAKKAKAAKPAPRPAEKPKPAIKAAAAKPAVAKPAAGKAAAKPAPAKAPVKAGAAPAPRPAGRKSSRRSSLSQRRGPDGQPFVPGDLLLPGGAKVPDEVQYFLRGSAAAEHTDIAVAVGEILAKRGSEADRAEIERVAETMRKRFERSIEPLLPARPPLPRRTFQSVIERAKHRRREIGAFLRGLDLGRTETSHMDSHGEASLDSLMKWAAHLENLAEADEPEGGDFTQHHRFLDNLENSTEALIIDVEQTLRRVRDRVRLG